MAKLKTYPIILEELIRLDIKTLRSLLIASSGQKDLQSIKWEQKNPVTGKYDTIGQLYIVVSIAGNDSSVELQYRVHRSDYMQRITLSHVEANIGEGIIWYFVCPKSGVRCRHLYLYGNHFVHRSCISHALYEKDVISKANRAWYSLLREMNKRDSLAENLNKKYFKSVYKGIPTKRL